MKYLRNIFYLGILLLTLLAACGPATPTPINDNLIPFPDVVVTVVPPVLKVACIPPEPSIDKIISFCANKAAGQGGVTYYGPAAYNWATTSNGNNEDCDFSTVPKVACAGPQNTIIEVTYCMSCGLPQPEAFGAFVCSDGYVNDGNGNCINPNPIDGVTWFACPTGSHYDDGMQNCADDVTNKLASPCPPDYPYYIPDFHYCLATAPAVVYNCQSFTLQLGSCPLPPLPPLPNINGADSCQPQSCDPGYSWDSQTCACVCPSGHC